MSRGLFQYPLWGLHLAIACVALVLGAAGSVPVRFLIVAASAAFVLWMTAVLGSLAVLVLFECRVNAAHCVSHLVASPALCRRYAFERRLARLRQGQSSDKVQSLLGKPARVDGFGDRLYWSYLVAGRRYMVSLDPRRLVAKYSRGLTPDHALARL